MRNNKMGNFPLKKWKNKEMRGLDWGVPGDSIGSDLWSPPPMASRTDEQANALSALAHLTGMVPTKTVEHISRVDSLIFAEHFRSCVYNVLKNSDHPLSTSQIHQQLTITNPEIVKMLDQRKSTSCSARLLADDPKHQFIRFVSSDLTKKQTFFGLAEKEYSTSEWLVKVDLIKPPEQSHKCDIEAAENIRVTIKHIFLQTGNKPQTCSEILELIKNDYPSLYTEIKSKSRNYLIKTLRRDPQKRFICSKIEMGKVAFSLGLSGIM